MRRDARSLYRRKSRRATAFSATRYASEKDVLRLAAAAFFWVRRNWKSGIGPESFRGRLRIPPYSAALCTTDAGRRRLARGRAARTRESVAI